MLCLKKFIGLHLCKTHFVAEFILKDTRLACTLLLYSQNGLPKWDNVREFGWNNDMISILNTFTVSMILQLSLKVLTNDF